MTPVVFYIAAIAGAVGVYWTLPGGRSMARVGGLLAAAALGLAVLVSLSAVTEEPLLARIHMGLFTLIAGAAAVRVITHTRPVYSALYFVLVVLSSAGMLVLLEAEFMAFAMVIIYGGAILITYMFVIMLATLPQTEADAKTSAVYDRFAREPGMAVFMGFALIAVLSHVIVASGPDATTGRPAIARYKQAPKLAAVASKLPRKVRIDDADTNTRHVTRLERLLRGRELIGPREHVFAVDFATRLADVREAEGAAGRSVELDDAVLGEFVANIDQVGLNLFEGHTLGIELAGVILLLSMVGAIVIARQKVPEHPEMPT